MILLRDHNAPMPLLQCGLCPSKRITFYDQVHTTGMDIKQCVNARAVVTLGKDMTFRDYAQGAYRMRGIAAGQSICLFLIPEVENRINHEMKLAKVELTSHGSAQQRLDAFLLLVPAWLLTNSMRMESMQFVQLSLQELHNTWRKRALYTLLDEIDGAVAKKASLVSRLRRFLRRDDDNGKAWLRDCIALFRVEVSYTVDAAVPTKKQLSDVVGDLIETHNCFLTTGKEMARVTGVKGRLLCSRAGQQQMYAEDTSEQCDLRLTAEVVHENEAEAEEEAEEETEHEEQKMSASTRDDEHPVPWSAYVLAQQPAIATLSERDNETKMVVNEHQEGASVFYPFSQFQAHAQCPKVDFPAELLMSDNFFRRRWVGLGERRVKNVGLILEWSPLLHQTAMKTVVQQLFMTFMTADASTKNASEIAVKALQSAAEMANMSPDVIPAAITLAVTSMMTHSPVYLATLSLAEGETIRRMIHDKHPVFQISQVQLRTSDGELIESSSFFSAWAPKPAATISNVMPLHEKTIAAAVQCLRFFNNEMYYSPKELDMLLVGLAAVPIMLRHEFFNCLLRLRRRERHLWEDTPLAKVFTAQSEWHLLTARARLQQFQQSLLRKQRQYKKKAGTSRNPVHAMATPHLAVALRQFDEDEDGRLTAEEIYKCLESFHLGFSSKELNEIISLIVDVQFTDGAENTSQELKVPLPAICASFGISSEEVKTVLIQEDQKGDCKATSTIQEPSWSCLVCTYLNEGEADTCEACSEANPQHHEVQQPQRQEWRCGNCTFINRSDDATCAICELDMAGQRGVPRGKWICAAEQGGCTFFNSMAAFYCEVCNRARPDLVSTQF
uniref:ubiquitinyl hydrolase 1 n=1 Tax=Hyaloperonospora arabidopsidis (strain Emoy2) TaxID=559515 RepID=M4BT13_HYAAE